MPGVTAGDIVDLVEGAYSGDRELTIRGVRSLSEAGPGDLSFLANLKLEPLLTRTGAGAILVPAEVQGDKSSWIRVKDPYFALSRVLETWFATIPRPSGISPLASISESAKVGERASIGPFVTIGDGAAIGDDVTIFQGSSIGAGCTIGDGTIIHANVSIYHRCQIGRRCIIHSSAVVGSDGYGFATVDGIHHKIPQIGIVRIEDEVEVGAGTTIDRAALGETVIGMGTKIDNLVQIGHNVKIGRHCLLVAQVGIAGSTEIGDHCVFGGQSGASGHLRIGSKVMVAAKSAVMKNWEGPAKIAGVPARPLREHLRSEALLRKLPELSERLDALENSDSTAKADKTRD